MHKVENVAVAILGVLGFGVSKTLLTIPGPLGIIFSLFWSAVASGVGVVTKMVVEFLVRRLKIFILRRRKKPDQTIDDL